MSLKGKKILISYGPTAVPIDRVRVISNMSSGAMGRCLITALRKKKARVTVLEGLVREPWRSPGVEKKRFFFYEDLKKLINQELKQNYAVFIHAAAVCDYRVKKVRRGKIRSGQKDLHLDLVPTPKLIRQVKKKAPDIFLVGFKLEAEGRQSRLKNKALDLIRENRCDLAVANAVTASGQYSALIVDRDKNILARADSRPLLARQLIQQIERAL